MKKMIVLSMLASRVIFSYQGEVKKADIVLTVNEHEKTLKKGDVISLNAGDIVCYKSGEGRLVIKGDGYKKQLNKKSSLCRDLPVTNGNGEKINARDVIASVFAKSKEKSIEGVSRKAVDAETEKIVLNLEKGQKYIRLENDLWGPLPIKFTIIDDNNQKVKEMEYADDDELKASFLIPVSEVNKGYTLKVTNAFGDTLAVVIIER